jgi:long-chain acyl-CoA synthetase
LIAYPPATRPSLPYRIVPDLLANRVRATPDRIAFWVLDDRDAWQPVTWREYAERVARIALGLRVAGLGRGHRAAILAPTSIEWELAQMACLTQGISVVGVDINYPVEQRDDVLRSVQIDALFVHDEISAASIPTDVKGRIERLVTFHPGSGESPPGVTSLHSLMRNIAPAELIDASAAAETDDEALVVFSSGTTGRPKAIPYTHRQVLAAVTSILDAYPEIAEGSHLLCWLPLANLFQRIVDFCGIQRGASSYLISDPKEVMRYVCRANPHLLIGVPRFYEKLHAGIRDRIAASPRPMSALAVRALAAGATHAMAARERRKSSAFRRGAAKVARRLVRRRLRGIFGSNLRYLVSGSAPMPLWLLDWFDGVGLPVLEAYGISENIIPVAMNRPGERRPGTVGKPLPGQDVRLAEDEEILVRGPGVFLGYLTAPGEAAMGPDREGFWATGDYGELDADGFLRLVGRKSDVFKLSTGRWIAPADIEALLRRLPYVEHAMVLGAGHRFLVALISIESATVVRAARRGDIAARIASLSAQDASEIIRRDVSAATMVLAPYQRPTGVLVTMRRFTIESGELTANLKLRRSAVEPQFAAKIQGLLAALEARAEALHERAPDEGVPLLVHWA